MNAFAQFFTTQQALRPGGLEATAATENVIDISNLKFAWRKSASPVLDIDNLLVEYGE